MRKWLILLGMVIFLISTPVQAQSTVRVESFQVDIWPEFDRSAVLVIYHVTLSPDTTLPATVDLLVPAQAEVNAVAVLDPANGLMNAQFTRLVSEDWATLSIVATTPSIQVEYYNVLVKDGTTRLVDFVWPGGLAVDGFSVSFLTPVGATGVNIQPGPVETRTGQNNMLEYVSETVPLSVGDTYSFSIRYEKTNDDLSVSGMQVQPSEPLEQTNVEIVWSDILPWVIGGLGLGLIVLGLLFLFGFLRSGPRSRWKSKPRRHGTNKTVSEASEKGKSNSVYCHECGHRAQSGDQFCRTCGARLRREE